MMPFFGYAKTSSEARVQIRAFAHQAPKSTGTKPAVQILPAVPASPSAPTPTAPVAQAAPGSRINSYARGNCTWYVASRRYVPPGWGNARSWFFNAQRSGYKTGSMPIPGAIAWSGTGWLGHVAYVESVNGTAVTLSEMNYTGWNKVSRRTVPAGNFLYIY